ncbi:ABC transporter permease [Bariatricus massiliensis]|uniref:ABC transporter permease n=1 Tax=Bariatricus massiliensis TaxID=1745713 RepID=A0ABS8DDV7_9FIRM|nr:ABC transporter permease [Bariatricus massiliensis]MCB7302709.1 ABC transporter permease [Bariatricus massiliensis]MCB7373925.1 ABC transporter permease [Bariatricus massiliensis]MCB7386595.1 ABC transporter permease [Bariatricus massiliensis]MCB7410757.1 ABC transporter permease [Bariatricus massiliensis]MCQ5253404.1 ABC transporter permease [Bariatricus massiliensis]
MNLASNDNRNVISHLAKSSVKSNKLRNFFTVFAIALSVSLLAVISLYISGRKVAEMRQVEHMQHVIYEAIEEEQALAMAKEEEVSVLMRMKSGIGIELGSKIIQPNYYDETPVKGKVGEIAVNEIEEGGTFPEKLGEVAVTKEYCELIGVEPKVGSTIMVTAIDGTTEEFVICGLLKGDWKNASIYPIIFSKEYADNGAMLAGTPYKAVVKIKDARYMQQSRFEEKIVELGKAYGVKRSDVNPNNYFTGTLEGDSLRSQERIVFTAICVGILFISILVIYSVFYLSVIGRIRQFGQLRTLGMTKKQIRRMVTREGLMLSGIGIPIGLLIGGTIGYFIQKSGWDWMRTLIIGAVIMVADVITVWMSIYKPAMLAAEISPIEAAKFTGELKEKKRKKAGKKREIQEAKKLKRSMTPMGLAKISAGRNRKKTFLTVLSLGIGGILFMLAATFITATNLDEYSRQGEFAWGEYAIILSNNAAETNEHGMSGLQKDNPLNEELKEQLLSIDGVKKVRAFTRMEMKWEARGEASTDYVHPFDEAEYKKVQDKFVDKDSPLKGISYNEMVENRQIFVAGNSVVEEVFGWRFEVGDKVKVTFDNGGETLEKEYTIAGFVENWRYNKEAPAIGWFCMPQALVDEVSGNLNLNDEYIVDTDERKEKAIESQIQDILKEKPDLVLYTLRERKLEDTKSFTLVYTVILGLSIFIIGFSMLNLVNTLITNVVTRKQEFAMLQSVGMSRKQLNRMVCLEGLLLSAGNAVITLIFGTVFGYAGIQIMRELAADYMHYKFPLWFYLGYLLVLVIVPMLVSGIILKGFQKQALTERLRVED